MLWWFLILGVSAAMVVSVAIILFVRVRRQMKRSAAHKAEIDVLDHVDPSWPPEA
jgi:preprotein translocase subunit YajC